MNINDLKEVTSGSLFTDKQFSQPDPNGILSEVLFGPINNYKCSCGNYNSKSLYAEQTCPKCGVKCTTNDLRYKTFAKINLLFPIIKRPKQEAIIKIIKRQYKNLIDPIQSDFNKSILIFMKYNDTTDEIKLVNNYDSDCIPLAITGLYSLYLCFYITSVYYGSTLASIVIKEYFTNTFLVTPPDTRSTLVATEDGNTVLYKSEVDDLYANLLNINVYNKTNFGELVNTQSYYDMVKISLDNNSGFPIIDETLKMLDNVSSYFQYYCNRIHDHINSSLSGKEGLIRRDLLGKTIDFSSRAIVTCSPELLAFQVKIPRTSFIKLFYLEYSRFLKVYKGFVVDQLRILVKRSDLELESTLDFLDEFIDWFFKNSQLKQRLLILNRVPSLWKFSIPIVEVVGINNNDAISVSPMIIDGLNMDFDGDTASLFKIHDNQAQEELLNESFYLNNIKHDHNEDFLSVIKNEAIFAFFTLAMTEPDPEIAPIKINKLSEVTLVYDLDLNYPIQISDLNNKIYSYGICLLNKWLYNKIPTITAKNNAQDCSKVIYNNSINNRDYHEKLIEFNKNLNWFIATHTTQTLSFELDESCGVLANCLENTILKNLPENPYIGYYIYNCLVDQTIKNLPKDYNLTKLLKSKFKREQFARSVISIGYVADELNHVYHKPINATLLGGLTEEDFFLTSIGTRKGLQ